jgi:hypothetical protein
VGGELHIQSQHLSHATAIIRIGLVKHGGLPQLNAFLDPTQVVHDVADEVIPILVGISSYARERQGSPSKFSRGEFGEPID